jgi:hypothetical protein
MAYRPSGWIWSQVMEVLANEMRSQPSGGNWRALDLEMDCWVGAHLWRGRGPANEVADHIGVAHNQLEAVLALLGPGPVKILAKR